MPSSVTTMKRENVLFLVPNLNLGDLPQDIIEDILIRLPVKALKRFTCVCKPWLCLISNSKFIKTHLAKSSLDITKHKLLVCHGQRTVEISGYKYFLKSCSLNFYKDNNDGDTYVIDNLTKYFSYHTPILGSCNGLVCLDIGDFKTIIWNPVTKKSKKLPIPCKTSQYVSLGGYGFGYDQTNDDYNVVNIFSNYLARGGKSEVQVYSLKTDSWKKIGDFLYSVTDQRCGIHVKGVLHWMAKRTNTVDMVIVSLDLENESYGEVPQPSYSNDNGFFSTLGVLDECLCVFCNFYYNDTIIVEHHSDIWVMKNNDGGDTWIKLYTIPFLTPSSFAFPLYIYASGEILVKSHCCFELYNPSTCELRDPMIHKLPRKFLSCEAITYVESLVSPNIDDEVPRPQD